MTDSNDISKLFKQIGVSGADYQEINKQNGARDSQSRWPLLNSLHAQANRAPSVDTRRRFDMEPEVTDAQSAGAPADDALFTHIATDEVVQAHEQATTSVTQAADIDRRATHAAMAAVDAAPAPAETAPEKQIAPKIAEFISPRANLLSGHLRPSAHRAPFDPSKVEGPVTGHATSRAAPASPITPASSPIYAEPIASTAASAATPSAAALPTAPLSAAPAAAPAEPATTLAQRLFAAAQPNRPPSLAPVAPVASAAPVAPARTPASFTATTHAQPAARPLAEAALAASRPFGSAQAPAALPTTQARPAAAPAAIGGLFARLAHPEGPPADAPTEPVAQAAPVSLFDRLIRS